MDSSDWSATDSDIYLPLRVGDPVAVELAYDRYGGIAYGLAQRILADPEQAEDVVQEVFLRIWNNPTSFDPSRGSFRTWLLRLIRNRSIDVLRSRQRRALPIELPADLTDASPGSDPWQTLALNLEQEAIRRGLAALPTEQRDAVELAYLGGYTHTEIAERLGAPLGTVKGRLRLGLEKLYTFMRESGLVIR